MFTIEGFLNDDFHSDYTEEKIGGETFLVRRMNGLERLAFLDCSTIAERIIYTLAHCLLDGGTKQPIGEKNAKKFIERYDAISEAVATRIIDITTEATRAEKRELGIAEKNLKETSGNIAEGNIAVATD